MKKCILFFAAIWMTLCFCSCDDGRIYEKEVNIQRGGRAMKLTGRFSGISNWTDDYSVVVAGFNDKSEYAVITKSGSQSGLSHLYLIEQDTGRGSHQLQPERGKRLDARLRRLRNST